MASAVLAVSGCGGGESLSACEQITSELDLITEAGAGAGSTGVFEDIPTLLVPAERLRDRAYAQHYYAVLTDAGALSRRLVAALAPLGSDVDTPPAVDSLETTLAANQAMAAASEAVLRGSTSFGQWYSSRSAAQHEEAHRAFIETMIEQADALVAQHERLPGLDPDDCLAPDMRSVA